MDDFVGIIRIRDDIECMHNQRRFLLLFGILVLYGIPLLVIAGQETSWSLYTLLRIAGVWGFISLSLGALLNLKKGAVKSQFGRPFLKIHHYFAISGLILITLHPVLYAYLALDPGVFIPDFSPNKGERLPFPALLGTGRDTFASSSSSLPLPYMGDR